MSPEPRATDHVYHQLKLDFMAGRHPPSSILNVHQIATEVGVSVSPVRDAMERLVGERLVVARAGGGFQVPAIDEAALRDLYLWHGRLAHWAVTRGQVIVLPQELRTRRLEGRWEDDETIVQATTTYFQAIGAASSNVEHDLALRSAGERLHATRLSEGRLIKDRKSELHRLVDLTAPGRESLLREAIAAYHRRRLRIIPALVSSYIGQFLGK